MSDTFKRSPDLSREEKRALLAELLHKKATEAKDWSPLSHGQQALWFLHRLAPESPAYNLIYAAHIRSTLDIPALQQSVQTLVQRHPILMATYSMRNGELVQRFHVEQKMSLDVIDASSWSWQDLNDRLHEEGDRSFDLEQGPILRIKVFRRSAQNHVLSLTVHHIAADFLSLEILIDELRTLYAANVAAAQAPLPTGSISFGVREGDASVPAPHPSTPAPTGISPARMESLPTSVRQYTDYVRWQGEMLAGPQGERLWAYWQQELAGELAVLNLPTDRPRPAVQTYRGISHNVLLDEELSGQLKALASAEKVTLFMLLLAAFEVLLLRYTNQDDILIGTPTAGRSRADLARIVGYLVNPVVLRANLADNPTYKELLSRVRRTVIGALEHQDYPFPLLVERLQPRRDPSYSPLFQCMFIWDKPYEAGETSRSPRQAQETLSLESLAFEQRGAPFDLTLRMSEVDGVFSADFRYNVDLFDAATISRMAQHFQTLLAGIVADPGQRVQDLPLLSAAEQHQLLVEWNDTKSDYPADVCIHQLFELQVQRTPDAVAVVFENEQLTYRELNRQANALAHTLQALGVGPEVLAGVCMERSLEMVVALLGILKAGGAYVPLDPTYPRERLDYMVRDAQMPVLLTQKRLLHLLPGDGMKILCLDTDYRSTSFGVREGDASVPAPHPATPAPTGLSPARMEEGHTIPRMASTAAHRPPDGVPAPHPSTPAPTGIGQVSQENPVSNVQPDNLVYMIYTSGSTGRPKGVMNIHSGLANRLHWMQQAYQLTAADRVLQKTPFSFDVSVWEFFWPLLTGACLVVARPGGHQDPAYLVSLIAEQRITTLHFVPSMLQVFLMTRNLERCNSLKRVICSGEALSVELQERFFSCLDAELHNLYGPTEAAIDVTYWQCQPDSGQLTVPIGRPIANTQMYILNQSLQPVPIGVPGELYIGGVGVARGYFNRPELTAEKFVPDPFSQEAGKRLFKTGDLARYRPDGAIEFLGRIDYQVKLRGFRIELGEIEAVLAQHAAVKEVVVMAREDTPGDKRLVAYVVPDQESVPTHNELRSFLGGKLPDYMVPSAFVMLDALPLTPNGKVDRRVLPRPTGVGAELQTPYVGPRTEVESTIVAIWKEVLHVEKVGIYDNFFDLGGHSLLMAQAHNLLQERLKRDVSIIELFEYPTIDALTRYLSQGKSERSDFQHGNGRAEKLKEGKNRQMQQLKQRQRAAKKGGSLHE